MNGNGELYMNSKNILIVDDEAVNHLLYQKMLNSSGWSNTVYCAYNGMQALEILEIRCREELVIPDLILLDLHMPRMDGIEFMAALRGIECLEGRHDKIVIAVVTASMDPVEFEKARSLGVRHIFSKPLSKVQLESISKMEFDDV
jgi:CheY-like chemotaxis protein